VTSLKKPAEILIANLIAGWYESIMKSPEIKYILTGKERKINKKKREQISKRASTVFLDKYDGINLLRNKDAGKIKESIIESVIECLK